MKFSIKDFLSKCDQIRRILSCYLYATRTIKANQVGEESGCVRTLPYQQYEEKVFQINMEK